MKKLEINPRMLEAELMTRCKLHTCHAACCIYGVWIDSQEVREILENVSIIQPEMPTKWRQPETWFDDREDTDEFSPSGKVFHSRVVDAPRHYGGTACVFLRSDHKCALQTASQKDGRHPWALKPFYCVLHPLDLDEKGRITLDDAGLLLDEPGSCLRPSPEKIPLLVTFEPELRYFLGDQEYEKLLLLVP
ncbi:DUF3109 family protein [Leptolinea tardivitalis]|uniref:DUF3109 family protein n=1 Tax=Leptolinea tardivitalis TaxID=229920 RepID=A0A0P6WUE4_9CHLR|nr:DUF3109 family protein [Leptolinea tardivitalis]KPL72773.1 hypothetical protein ADM99_06780 [Leptolinea tardivitalis]GAP20874.1 hypothetical protein LTAR_01074 [Leptolinea tardivitalis]